MVYYHRKVKQQIKSYDITNLVPRSKSVSPSPCPVFSLDCGWIPSFDDTMAVRAYGGNHSPSPHSHCHCHRYGAVSVVLGPFGYDVLRVVHICSTHDGSSSEQAMNEESSIMVKCECHGEALEVTHWPNKDCPDEIWFSI